MSEKERAPSSSTAVTVSPDGIRKIHTANPVVVDRGQGERPPEPEPEPEPERPEPAAAFLPAEEEDFEELLASSAVEAPPQAFNAGDKVSGVVEIISLRGPEIFLDLGGRSTGYILKEEFLDENGELTVKQGDVIEGVVGGTDAHGVRIQRSLSASGAHLEDLEDARANELPVQGRVASANKGGYEVHIGSARAFCPFSQIDLYRPEDESQFIGQTLDFLITEIKGRNNIVLSRAALLKAEQANRAEETRKLIVPGARLPGVVRSIQPFGAFVDLGGIDGLIHASELAWERVEDPSTVVSKGERLEVIVLEVDDVKDRIALSLRRTQSDPFEAALETLRVGETVNGQVVRLTAFGAFVNLAPSVDGLVHISDLAHYRVRHPKEVVKVGDQVRVRVLSLDLDARRIALSMKALAEDPWDSIEGRYRVDQAVTGTVRKVESFGVFIELEPGVTALLPASESGIARGKPLATGFKPGHTVEVRVLRIEADNRRMALTLRDSSDVVDAPPRDKRNRRGAPGKGRPRPTEGRSWRDRDEASEDVGSFGAALMDALNKKDT